MQHEKGSLGNLFHRREEQEQLFYTLIEIFYHSSHNLLLIDTSFFELLKIPPVGIFFCALDLYI